MGDIEPQPDTDHAHRLLDAVVDVTRGLDLASILERLIASATTLVGARYGALGVLDATGTRLEDFITVGLDDETRAAIGPLPVGHGILGLLIDGDEPVRLDDLTHHPAATGFPPNHPPMGSFLGVPIRVRNRTFGNLYLTEKRASDGGPAPFTAADEDLIVGLAAAAGVAIDNARLHERVARLALADDRARIARDLHDTVIQRLFATGLSLQATVTLCGDEHPEAAERIGTAIDELDLTVKHIRTVIFGLDGGRHGASLRDDVLATCQEAAGPLGFAPRTVFEGPVDAVVPTDLRDDVLAVLRESLTNVARHAGARRVDVAVHASPSALEVTVDDDGRGGALPRDGGRGIRNLRSRAETRNGTYAVDDRPAGGTRVRWTVPLP